MVFEFEFEVGPIRRSPYTEPTMSSPDSILNCVTAAAVRRGVKMRRLSPVTRVGPPHLTRPPNGGATRLTFSTINTYALVRFVFRGEETCL